MPDDTFGNIARELDYIQRSQADLVARHEVATRLGRELAAAVADALSTYHIIGKPRQAVLDAYHAYVTAEAGNFLQPSDSQGGGSDGVG